MLRDVAGQDKQHPRLVALHRLRIETHPLLFLPPSSLVSLSLSTQAHTHTHGSIDS